MIRSKWLALIVIVVFVLTNGSPVFATNSEEETVLEIQTDWENRSLEDLIERAKSRSLELQRINQQLKRSEIMRDQAGLNVGYTYAPEYHPLNPMYTIEEFIAKQATLGVYAADAQINQVRRDRQQMEDRIEYQVITAWIDIEEGVRKVLQEEKALSLAEQELAIARVRQQQGISSRYQLIQQEDAYEAAQNELTKSKVELDGKFITLNGLLNEPVESRYWVEREAPSVEELPNLTAQIARVLNNDPLIKSLESNVELSELSLRLYVYNQEQDPYSAKAIDLTTASLNAGNMKRQTENSLRELYQSMEEMDKTAAELELQLKMALDQLNVAKINLEVGLVIPQDVAKIEFQVSELENALKSLESKKEKMSLAYLKPWAAR
ncbi:TolC family protein [Anoxynatronum sibiricum]|uniref:TolC family protein n=2 Tax=Anoxynatronum sibiricum TaxID=210623 RepID=A0ABU9VXW6_9CLOT